MHFLITGHTGFKGSWLSLLLSQRGHQVSGISLEPEAGSLFERANLNELFEHHLFIDIRNTRLLNQAIEKIKPDVVIHMAAQSIVQIGYSNPAETFEVNINGTLNVLKSTSKVKDVKSQIIVTTDKVYKSKSEKLPYTEKDPLGGDDPYSASKSIADLMTQKWVENVSSPRTAIVRAGNVIGGGDISSFRLLPNLLDAYEENRSPKLRYPTAVRPWQHVLDCLNGYLSLLDLNGVLKSGVWNFGPQNFMEYPVFRIAEMIQSAYMSDKRWQTESDAQLVEAMNLTLDSTKARKELGWVEKLPMEESVAWVVNWHQLVSLGESPRSVMEAQIQEFERI
jgi:CDP-glucose 4,6-dehydratase